MTIADLVSFDEVEALVTSAASLGIRPGLERIGRLLQLLGEPQSLYPAVHVVGTNGKGSTCAFLASVLQRAGCKTAFYSSPHLESPGERLLIDGRPLPARRWMEATRRVLGTLKADLQLSSDPPSYFELVTATAFLLAAEERVEVAVVEAGLGGRLDATNLLRNVACSVVTSISMDHTEYLGDTLEKVAGEKFAVVRSGIPACFLGDNPTLVPLFESYCLKADALPFVVGRDAVVKAAVVTETGTVFDFETYGLKLDGLRINLLGRYQVSNASLALLALSRLSKTFPGLNETTIRKGMEAARWPGRLEIISHDPLVVLDGGHNADGVEKLEESLVDLWGSRGKRIGVVYAVMKDKDYSSCLESLSELTPAFYATSVPGMERSLSPDELARAAARWPWRNVPSAFDSPLDAVAAASWENDVVVVCGSLYLVGWIRPKLRDFLKGARL